MQQIPVFLSYPKPSQLSQQKFIDHLTAYLKSRGISPRTLGVTDYDLEAPLNAIRRLMIESNGLITVAFRRTFIQDGTMRFGTDIPGSESRKIEAQWLTSPWSQIEPAMAYQLGLPILILRESNVLDEGILERGVAGLYSPEFNLDNSPDDYFSSNEWHAIISEWEGYVGAVVDRKGSPPQLY